MTRMNGITALLGALALSSGCSTIVGERYNHVNIATVPPGANYEVRRAGDDVVVASGVTPNVVKLKSSAGYFKRGSYSVRLHKDGYQDTTVPLSASMRGTYWGNLLVGGPIGMLIVDPASGAMWGLPRKVDAQLPADSSAVQVVSQPTAAPLLTTSNTGPGMSQEQQLQELQQQSLSFEEYQRRYREIVEQ